MTTGIARKLLLTCLLVTGFAVWTSLAPAANAVRGWTTQQAAANLKAKYTAPDPKAAAVIQANIDQEKAGCGCDTNARIASLLVSLEATKHAAKVTSASCKGASRATQRRFARFHCMAKIAGTFRPPPDYVPYSATVKITLRVPYRVLAGWR